MFSTMPVKRLACCFTVARSFAVFGLLAVILFQCYFGCGAHHGKRCAELMGSIRHELALLSERCAQAIQQLIEGRGQAPYFVAGMVHRQPVRKIARSDLPGGFGIAATGARLRRARNQPPTPDRITAKGTATRKRSNSRSSWSEIGSVDCATTAMFDALAVSENRWNTPRHSSSASGRDSANS